MQLLVPTCPQYFLRNGILALTRTFLETGDTRADLSLTLVLGSKISAHFQVISSLSKTGYSSKTSGEDVVLLHFCHTHPGAKLHGDLDVESYVMGSREPQAALKGSVN